MLNELQKAEQVFNRIVEFNLFTKEEITVFEDMFLAVEINLANETNYISFIKKFNQVTGKKYKPDKISRDLWYKHEAYHSLNDRLTAVKNALTDPWIKSNLTVLTPQWILKPENIAKYINYEAPKTEQNGQSKNFTPDL